MTGTAVGYIRRSASEESPVSEDAQRATIARLAAERGDTVVQVFRDWGKSGGSETRPGYMQMLARLEANGIEAVYSYDQDRLARSNWMFAGLLRLADLHGFKIITPAGDISADRVRDMTEIRGVMDGAELRKIQRRNRAIADRRLLRGDDRGALPFGYVTAPRVPRSAEPVRYVVANPEGIAHVIETYRDDGTFLGTARRLNAESFPGQRGGTWHAATVKGVILREAPDLVRNLAPGARRASRPRLFSGLLRCWCGGPMSPGTMHGKDTWYCGRGQRGLHQAPYTVTESAITEWLRAEADRLRVPGDVVEMTATDDQRAALDAKRGRIVDLMTDGILDKPEGLRRLADVDGQLSALGAREAVLELPGRIDWNEDPVDAINLVLRTLWRSVRLGQDLRPEAADWTVPAWRAD